MDAETDAQFLARVRAYMESTDGGLLRAASSVETYISGIPQDIRDRLSLNEFIAELCSLKEEWSRLVISVSSAATVKELEGPMTRAYEVATRMHELARHIVTVRE